MDQRTYCHPSCLPPCWSNQISFQKQLLSTEGVVLTSVGCHHAGQMLSIATIQARCRPYVHLRTALRTIPYSRRGIDDVAVLHLEAAAIEDSTQRLSCASELTQSEISKSFSNQVGQWGGADSTWRHDKPSGALTWVHKLNISLYIKRKPLYFTAFFLLAASLSTSHHEVGASMVQRQPRVVAGGSKPKSFLSAHLAERDFPLSPRPPPPASTEMINWYTRTLR